MSEVWGVLREAKASDFGIRLADCAEGFRDFSRKVADSAVKPLEERCFEARLGRDRVCGVFELNHDRLSNLCTGRATSREQFRNPARNRRSARARLGYGLGLSTQAKFQSWTKTGHAALVGSKRVRHSGG